MGEKVARLTIHAPKKKIKFGIPEDLSVDDVIGTCMLIAALLTGMKAHKPSVGDHSYVANAGFEETIKDLDTSLEKILDTLFMIDYEYKFKNKQKHMNYSCGCALSSGYTVDEEGYIHVHTIFDEGINKWLEGKLSISEAIKENFLE